MCAPKNVEYLIHTPLCLCALPVSHIDNKKRNTKRIPKSAARDFVNVLRIGVLWTSRGRVLVWQREDKQLTFYTTSKHKIHRSLGTGCAQTHTIMPLERLFRRHSCTQHQRSKLLLSLLFSLHIIACTFTTVAALPRAIEPTRPIILQAQHVPFTVSSHTGRISPPMTPTNRTRPTIDAYLAQRQQVIRDERNTGFESDAPELTDREQLANAVVMAAKNAELAAGHSDPHTFGPSQHFFDAMDQIRGSKLFKIIRRMPKGGILHAHDTALASVDFLVSLTYREHLWQCNDPATGSIVGFRFARQTPTVVDRADMVWTRTADERTRRGASSFDAFVRTHFTLRTDNPRAAYKDINDVWRKFMSLFMLVGPLVTYVPVWRDYYRQTLKEALEDNVQYVEFRGLLPDVYDLEGNSYSKTDIVQMYVDVLAEFRRENPTFIGSKFVYAPLKAVPDSTFEEYVTVVKQLHARFPDFLAGFDLVGQEDTGRTLISFAELLLQLPEEIRFFFHAGETNWFGSVDENLVGLMFSLLF